MGPSSYAIAARVGGDLNTAIPLILVIEDDEPIQAIIEDALEEAGFEPAIAPSGEKALTLLKGMTSAYRVIVTDIRLRGKLDGWVVAKQAREIGPGGPGGGRSGV